MKDRGGKPLKPPFLTPRADKPKPPNPEALNKVSCVSGKSGGEAWGSETQAQGFLASRFPDV